MDTSYLYIVAMLLLVLYAIFIFNGFVALRMRSEASWSDIDVQLKRRHNLIPRLVEAVKTYAAYERAIMEAVVEARTKGIEAHGVSEQSRAEKHLTHELRQLLAVVENYPDIKADGTFMKLQHELVAIEDAIQNARRYYNAVVRDYNTKIDSFPEMLIARPFRFVRRTYFELENLQEAMVPKVEW
ncbi:LemA family protein [Sulfurimonas sp. HSL-3221]|uniref:LemA family protein n=1 Tax=Sulfurimonadaceae TaxID=2771471 RepID=UPI001E361A5C|nr:LemA family protein [Sulfurimonas sp. HSL-3221]UFS63188.1 LemA family protein [Sulfurimonas sp. HSL-3221]